MLYLLTPSLLEAHNLFEDGFVSELFLVYRLLKFTFDFSDKFGLGRGVLSMQSTVESLRSITKSWLSLDPPNDAMLVLVSNCTELFTFEK